VAPSILDSSVRDRWWFWFYDTVLTWLPAGVAQPVGVIVVDLIAFAFWFLVVPKVRALRTRGQAV
jgi:hypothetical protein